MCIAIYQPAGKEISKDALRNCWDTNDDGAGMAWAYNGSLNVYKELYNFETFYEYYKHLVDAVGAQAPMLLHFRIRTHGLISLYNCHPQVVHNNLAFVHNGILSCVDVPKNSTNSDTAEFNEQIIQQLPSNFSEFPGIIKLLEHACKGSKLAFLNNKGEYLIINESAGHWDNEIWYSNESYKPKSYKTYHYTPGSYSGHYHHTGGVYGDWAAWDEDTGWTAAADGAVKTTIPKVVEATSLPAVSVSPNKDICMLCTQNELTEDIDKVLGVCGSCREMVEWNGGYVHDEDEPTDQALIYDVNEDVDGSY